MNLLKTKIPTVILLFYKTFWMPDVMQIIMALWWDFFSCEYLHKNINNITYACRHLVGRDEHHDIVDNTYVSVYQCLLCKKEEYRYYANWNFNDSLYYNYPNLSYQNRSNYIDALRVNLCRVNFVFPIDSEKQRFIKNINMSGYKKLLGSEPFEWNPYEAMLVPHYKKDGDANEFELALKRKREEELDMFFNKRQHIV